MKELACTCRSADGSWSFHTLFFQTQFAHFNNYRYRWTVTVCIKGRPWINFFLRYFPMFWPYDMMVRVHEMYMAVCKTIFTWGIKNKTTATDFPDRAVLKQCTRHKLAFSTFHLPECPTGRYWSQLFSVLKWIIFFSSFLFSSGELKE